MGLEQKQQAEGGQGSIVSSVSPNWVTTRLDFLVNWGRSNSRLSCPLFKSPILVNSVDFNPPTTLVPIHSGRELASSCPEIAILAISSVVLLCKTRIFLRKMDAYAVDLRTHHASSRPFWTGTNYPRRFFRNSEWL